MGVEMVVTTRRAAAVGHHRLQSATHGSANSNSTSPCSSSPGSSSASNDASVRQSSSVYSDSADSDSSLRFAAAVDGNSQEGCTVDLAAVAEMTSDGFIDSTYGLVDNCAPPENTSYTTIISEVNNFSESLPLHYLRLQQDNNNVDQKVTPDASLSQTKQNAKSKETPPPATNAKVTTNSSNSSKRRSRKGAGTPAESEGVEVKSGGGCPDITRGPQPPTRSARHGNRAASPSQSQVSPVVLSTSTSSTSSAAYRVRNDNLRNRD